MKKLLLLLTASLLFGCKKDAKTVQKNGDFEIELLFEIDGCKIYRFTDARTVYFSDCRGEITDTKVVRNGKGGSTTTYHETLNAGK